MNLIDRLNMFTLPHEIVREICSYCDYSTNFSLRWVCKEFIPLIYLPPTDKVEKCYPRKLLVRSLMTAIATVENNPNIVKWLWVNGYRSTAEGSILVGAYCDDYKIHRYCGRNVNFLTSTNIGKAFAGIPHTTDGIGSVCKLAAVLGGNDVVVAGSYNYYLGKIIKYDLLDAFRKMLPIINTCSMTFHQYQLSQPFIQLLLDNQLALSIDPMVLLGDIKYLDNILQLLDNPIDHDDTAVYVLANIKRIRYNPLLLLCKIGTQYRWFSRMLRNNDDPRVVRYYIADIVINPIHILYTRNMDLITQHISEVSVEMMEYAIQCNNYDMCKYLFDISGVLPFKTVPCNDIRIVQMLGHRFSRRVCLHHSQEMLDYLGAKNVRPPQHLFLSALQRQDIPMMDTYYQFKRFVWPITTINQKDVKTLNKTTIQWLVDRKCPVSDDVRRLLTELGYV